MSYPAITRWLRENSLEDLKKQYSVIFKYHWEYPNLVHLSYDQFETPKDLDFLRDCRSIILDTARDFMPVAWPFSRFCNVGEDWGLPPLDSDITAWEKLDGSMLIMWYYDKRWHVSTRGTIDGNTPLYEMPQSGMTYASVFWDIVQKDYSKVNWDEYQNYTLCFEFTSPMNRIVVKYQDTEIRLIAARNLLTGEEVDITNNKDFKIPKFVKITTIKEAEELANQIPAIEQEGWVIVDKDFNRRKLKSLEYVTYHRVRSLFSVRGIIDLWRKGEIEEFLSYFPEFRDRVNSVTNVLEEYSNQAETFYRSLDLSKSRKDFAIGLKGHPFSGYCFGRLDGKFKNIHEMYSSVNNNGGFTKSNYQLQKAAGLDKIGLEIPQMEE